MGSCYGEQGCDGGTLLAITWQWDNTGDHLVTGAELIVGHGREAEGQKWVRRRKWNANDSI